MQFSRLRKEIRKLRANPVRALSSVRMPNKGSKLWWFELNQIFIRSGVGAYKTENKQIHLMTQDFMCLEVEGQLVSEGGKYSREKVYVDIRLEEEEFKEVFAAGLKILLSDKSATEKNRFLLAIIKETETDV